MKQIGIAVGLTEYAYRHLPAEVIENLEFLLPAKVYETDDVNHADEPLVLLEDDTETIHPDFLIIEKPKA